MTDATSRIDGDKHANHAESTHSVNDSTTDASSKEPGHAELDELRDVVARYVGQLLYGCNDSTCTETLCDTGRRNTSSRPVRKYTPRSARSIAFEQVSRPNPRSRLCPRYVPREILDLPEVTEGPQDPSAFMQQFADTATIRSLELPDTADRNRKHPSSRSTATSHGEKFDACIRYCQTLLNHTLELFKIGKPHPIEVLLTENEQPSKRLCFCFAQILHSLPRGSTGQWRHVNRIISSGCAYPQDNENIPCDPSYNTWLDILDGLENHTTYDLIHQLMVILTLRDNLEHFTIVSSTREVPKDDLQAARLINKVAVQIGREVPGFDNVFHLTVILKKYFLQHWHGEVELNGLEITTLKLINCIRQQVRKARTDPETIQQTFSIPNVSHRLEVVEVAQAWRAGRRRHHILQFGFLFDLEQQATYFRTMNHLRMRNAHSDAQFASLMHEKLLMNSSFHDEMEFLKEHYLLLDVRRSHLLEDTFDQLWQRRSSELFRPLRVRLGEMDNFEIGHDLGGVQVEFFNLFCKELLNEDNQMFTTDPTTGFNYFRAGSLQPLYMFELCGLLFALAVYNGISLPIHLPKAFYYHLNSRRARVEGLELLDDAWPDTKRSLQHVLSGDASGFDNTVPLEINGLRLNILPAFNYSQVAPEYIELVVVDATPIVHHEARTNSDRTDGNGDIDAHKASIKVDIADLEYAWPGWHVVPAPEEPDELTEETKHKWATDYATWLTWSSVAPQFQAFLAGFERIFEDLDMLSFDYLKPIFEGTTHLDINELERVTSYEGYCPSSTYIQGFWTRVEAWSEEKQKELVKFVTACERLPPGGASNLKFTIARATHANEGSLPTSSTCFATLMLPRYDSVDILERKLLLALEYGAEGFGSA